MHKKNFTDITIFLLRVVAGYIFIQNGGLKLFGWFGDLMGDELPPLMLIAGILEFFGGLAILVGVAVRPVAFVLSGLMAVAYFMAHARSYWYAPLMNDGQPSVLLCFIFLFFAAYGAGRYSLDEWIERRKSS